MLKNFNFYIKIKEFIISVKDGFKSIHGLENKAIFLGTHSTYLDNVFNDDLHMFFSIEATQMLTLIDGLYAMIIGGYGMVAPVQGGIGAYHYIVKEGLMLISISEDSALLYATIVHTAQTLMTLSVGGISILMVFLTRKQQSEWQNIFFKKVIRFNSINNVVNKWRDKNDIVFTNGCFDILHLGHIHYLYKASNLGDKLIVGINTDKSVQLIKEK